MNAVNYTAKKIIWLFGPAAAGKSTCIKFINRQFLQQKRKVLIISDLEELMLIINKDLDQNHHKRLPSGQFEVANELLYNKVISQICQKLIRKLDSYDVFIIEVACGTGKSKENVLSLEVRLKLIPVSLYPISKFVYIRNSLARRDRFNKDRHQIAQTPPHIFNKYFLKDDFDKFENNAQFNFLVLDNFGSITDFYKQARILTK